MMTFHETIHVINTFFIQLRFRVLIRLCILNLGSQSAVEMHRTSVS